MNGTVKWWQNSQVQARDERAALARTASVRWCPAGGVSAFRPVVELGPELTAHVQADIAFRRATTCTSPGTSSPARDALRAAYWGVGFDHLAALELALNEPTADQVEGRDEDDLIGEAVTLVSLGIRAGSPAAAFQRFNLLGGHPCAGPEMGAGAGEPEPPGDGPQVGTLQGANQADVLGVLPVASPEPAGAGETGPVLGIGEAKGVGGGPECGRWLSADAEPLPGWAHVAGRLATREVDPADNTRHVPSRWAHATFEGFSRRPRPVAVDARLVSIDDYARPVSMVIPGTYAASLPSLVAYAVLVLTDEDEQTRAAAAGLTAEMKASGLRLLRLSCARPFSKRLRLYVGQDRFSECRTAASLTLVWRMFDLQQVTEAVWRDRAGKTPLVLRRAASDTVAVTRARAWDIPHPSSEQPVGDADADALEELSTELREVGLYALV